MLRRELVVMLVIVWLWVAHPVVAGPTALQAEIDPRIWQDLAAAPSAPVIVRLRELPTPPTANDSPTAGLVAQRQVEITIQAAQNAQRSLRAALDAQAKPYRSYWIVNILALEATLDEIHQLASRSDVLAIESNRAFRVPLETALPDPSAPAAAASIEPGLSYVNAPKLWDLGFAGQGMVVASADTGVEWQHPTLKSHYRGWNGAEANHNYSWWDAIHTQLNTGSNACGLNSTVPCDDYGHGTHTTGTMVGDDGSANQVGMAPAAQWIACRNMDGGVGRPSTYIECLQWFVAPTDLTGANPDVSKRPHIINNSYGCPLSEECSSTSLDEALRQVRAAGIFMAVSAGNSGSACATISDPPGLSPGVFTVGAMNSASGLMAGFSSRGPVNHGGDMVIKPDLVAPGQSVRSAARGGGYASMSGTSMAAPHVAGAVALLWSANPSLIGEIFFTEWALRQGATPLPVSQACGATLAGSVPNNTSGWGTLNVEASYQYVITNSPIKTFIPVMQR